MTRLTLRPTVIAGERLIDDYDVRWDGHDIGRIMLSNYTTGDNRWSWMINLPLPIPADCRGDAPSFDVAKERFKAAWDRFLPTLTPNDLQRAWDDQRAVAERAAAWDRRHGRGPGLVLKKVEHPTADENYRVFYDGVEIGSVGQQLGAGPRVFWHWGIDTVLPRQMFATEGEGTDREDCMRQFRATWQVFCADELRLAQFMEAKMRAPRR